MFSADEARIVYNLMNMPVNTYPFPHFVVEDVFPQDFYARMVDLLPPRDDYAVITETGRVRSEGDSPYENRYVFEFNDKGLKKLDKERREFWAAFQRFLTSPMLTNLLVQKFYNFLGQRFGCDPMKVKYWHDILLMKDFAGYEIGPHTDIPSRAIVMLFYLPRTADQIGVGTSIYAPKDPFATFDCSHQSFDKFHRLYTAPFKPNVMAGFLRNDRSFHGVEPIVDKAVERDLLLYVIRAKA